MAITLKGLVLGFIALLNGACPPSLAPIERVINHQSLVDNYPDYDGRIVRLSAAVLAGEGSIVVLPAQQGKTDKERLCVDLPTDLTQASGPMETEFLERLDAKGYVKATFEGTFHGRAIGSFGHMGWCRFKVDVIRVISLE